MAFKFNQKFIYIGVFIVGVTLIYMWSGMCGKSGPEGFENGGYQFVMYGVDWCPHCVSAKPKFAELGPKMTIDGKEVVCKIVNPEKEPNAVAGKKIEGYPTFHLYDSEGKLVKEYNGPREKSGFLKFLNETL